MAIFHQVFATVESIFHLRCTLLGLYCKTFQFNHIEKKIFNYVFCATLSSSELGMFLDRVINLKKGDCHVQTQPNFVLKISVIRVVIIDPK